MRVTASLLLVAASLVSAPTLAAEVVWVGSADPQLQAAVSVQAGAVGDPLRPIDLRAAATRFSDADADVYRALDAALAEARSYETKLDGELVIMRDLQRPVEAISVLRDEADRTRLRAALAYQGFAVNRYFADTLGEDDAAAEHRIQVDGVWVEKAWVDAVALDPDWEVTPYEIAEAPQRIAYGKVQQRLTSALPATLVPQGFPENAQFIVGGALTRVGPTGSVKVVPGRHLAHLVLDDRIIARWDMRLEPGQEVQLELPLDTATFRGFLDGLADGGSVPEAVVPSVEALGGEVWVARAAADGAEVFRVTPSGVVAVELERRVDSGPGGGGGDGGGGGGPSLSVGLMAGWFASGDFYTQNPVEVPRTVASVNAVAPALSLGLDLDLVKLLRVGVGLDLVQTLGAHHVALYGEDGSTRLRPHPHLAVGLKQLQLTAGVVFPYHPAVGARATVGVVGPVEVRAIGLYGPGGDLDRGAGVEPYSRQPLSYLAAGVGARF